MTQTEINDIVQQERLKLSFGQKITYYGLAFGLAIAPLFFGIKFIKELNAGIEIKGNYTEISLFIIFGLIISISIFIHRYLGLKFKTINANLTNQEFGEVLHLTAQELNWKLKSVNANYAVAESKPTFGQGERITILLLNGKILINSIGRLNQRGITFSSFGRNRKNVRTLERNILSK